MVSAKPAKKLQWKANSVATPGYIRDYLGLNRGSNDLFTQAAKDYTVQTCVDNIESLRYGLENHLISGKPYTMSELYEQAVYIEKAFTAGVQWAFQYVDAVMKKPS